MLQDAGRFRIVILRIEFDVEAPQSVRHGPAKQRPVFTAERAAHKVLQHIQKPVSSWLSTRTIGTRELKMTLRSWRLSMR